MPALTSAVDRAATIVVTGMDDGGAADEPGIGTLVGRAVEDARALAAAEIELYKARLGERLVAYRGAIVFFAVAGVLALCALIALLVGLIMTLATLIGPGLATAAVTLAVFAIAGVLAMIGKGRLAPPRLDDR